MSASDLPTTTGHDCCPACHHVLPRSGTDKLTGLPDRWSWDARAEDAIKRGADHALLLIDVDDFKSINDRLGHPAGDAVLAEVAHLAQRSVRSDAVLGRYGGQGGDEFLILLPSVTNDDALDIAERIEGAIRRLQIEVPIGSGRTSLCTTTASIGVATLNGAESDLQDLILRADSSLRIAKQNKHSRRGAATELEAAQVLEHKDDDDAVQGSRVRSIVEFTRLLSGQWQAEVLLILARESCRYTDLLTRIRSESSNARVIQSSVLNRTLRKMERDGLVERTEVHGTWPRTVEYSITRRALDALDALVKLAAGCSSFPFPPPH